MDDIDIPELVESLGSSDDSIRKRAAFRLQNVIGDPSFADVFETAGGLSNLRALALNATGNTLAYTLASLSRLLELDQGWSTVDQMLLGRLVQLVVDHPLVNILRGAMSILALVVAHPSSRSSEAAVFGFRALKPFIDVQPNFLEMLVMRLSSADHALCANALQLINALMRDSITNDAEEEWRNFIKRLQDLGVITAVYVLMQSSSLQDLAPPLLEFQFLTKILLRRWKGVVVDHDRLEHRRALRAIYLASQEKQNKERDEDVKDGNKHRDSEKWRRLGFQSENPASDFEEVGFLGVMDLTDFVTKGHDGFHKLVLEQAAKTPARRCPIARASIAVTSILYDHFEFDGVESEDHQRYVALESRTNFDKIFKPLLLHWSRLHTAGLETFLRLWETTGAEVEDFYKIEELVRILIEDVVGMALRTEEVEKIELDMAKYELHRLRELQMELLEMTHDDAWGHHLRQIKDELHHEALQFIKEQRIRCLLAGSWFPNITSHINSQISPSSPLKSATSAMFRPSMDSRVDLNARTPAWRYARLSHTRRFLHYADFDEKFDEIPSLDSLEHKVAMADVVSVVSKTEPAGEEDGLATMLNEDVEGSRNLHRPSGTTEPSRVGLGSQAGAEKQGAEKQLQQEQTRAVHTTITLLGKPASATTAGAQESQASARQRRKPSNPGLTPRKATRPAPQHQPSSPVSVASLTLQQQLSNQPATDDTPASLLTLHLLSPTLASEWLDGLLLLLNQAPITEETNSLVDFISKYGLKIRLLNVRFEEAMVVKMEGSGKGNGLGGGYRGTEVVLPGREGVDDEFFYADASG